MDCSNNVQWALHFTDSKQPIPVFIFSLLALIPMGKLLALSTEQLSLRVGPLLAGLIDVTLGNLVEVTVAIVALKNDESAVVQSTLIGLVLSNLLLVKGVSFLVRGIKFDGPSFDPSDNLMLLIFSAMIFVSPTAFDFLNTTDKNAGGDDQIQKLRYTVATISLFTYVCYLFFATRHSQSSLFTYVCHLFFATRRNQSPSNGVCVASDHATANTPVADIEAGPNGTKETRLNLYVTVASLLLVTAFVAITAECLVHSIEGLVESANISKQFVGCILLANVHNSERFLTVSVDGKTQTSGDWDVTVATSAQTVLFVMPVIIFIGQKLGHPLIMLLDPFQSFALLLSVVMLYCIVNDGKPSFFKGIVLICLYTMLGTMSFFFYQDAAEEP
ncbi:Calcium/proton exchanger [Mycena venus]|uniref:Calcium/proton exchanger n=1 Tax=Mycena venus TaxID=2733690 RepID=A0A8H6YPC6_9AGAR|nr:Calcium/proton exchanger [Mycena venus]